MKALFPSNEQRPNNPVFRHFKWKRIRQDDTKDSLISKSSVSRRYPGRFHWQISSKVLNIIQYLEIHRKYNENYNAIIMILHNIKAASIKALLAPNVCLFIHLYILHLITGAVISYPRFAKAIFAQAYTQNKQHYQAYRKRQLDLHYKFLR